MRKGTIDRETPVTVATAPRYHAAAIMPKFDTVSDIEAHIAFKRCTEEFFRNLSKLAMRAARDFEKAMEEIETKAREAASPKPPPALTVTSIYRDECLITTELGEKTCSRGTRWCQVTNHKSD